MRHRIVKDKRMDMTRYTSTPILPSEYVPTSTEDSSVYRASLSPDFNAINGESHTLSTVNRSIVIHSDAKVTGISNEASEPGSILLFALAVLLIIRIKNAG